MTLCLKPVTLKINGDKSIIFHYLYVGDTLIGKITANIFGKRKSNKPYLFSWVIQIGQPEPVFYADSIDEAKEFAIDQFREFILNILE